MEVMRGYKIKIAIGNIKIKIIIDGKIKIINYIETIQPKKRPD